MSFSKARRFSYSLPPSNKEESRRASAEFGKNETTADLVEAYRRQNKGFFQDAIDDFTKSPRSGNRRLNVYKGIPSLEKVSSKGFLEKTFSSTPKKKKINSSFNTNNITRTLNTSMTSNQLHCSRSEVGHSLKKEENIAKSFKSDMSSFHTCYDWDFFQNELAKIKEGCRILQKTLIDSSQEAFNTTQISEISMRFSDIEENENVDEICETVQAVDDIRDELKDILQKRVCLFRKKTEDKLKAFVKDTNNRSLIFLDAVQCEYDSITEGLFENENLKEVFKKCKANTRSKDIEKNRDFKKCTILSEQLKECRKYIKFVEHKYRELLITSDKKIAEQNQLIGVLKAELEASFLGDRLQNTLLRQSRQQRGFDKI